MTILEAALIEVTGLLDELHLDYADWRHGSRIVGGTETHVGRGPDSMG